MVEDVLDRRLSGSARRRLDLHLSRCRECRDFFAAEQAEHARWFRAVNSTDSASHVLPAGFEDRLVAAVIEKGTVKVGFWRRFRIPRWVGMAAGFAIMLMTAAMVVSVGFEEGSDDAAGASVETSVEAESTALSLATHEALNVSGSIQSSQESINVEAQSTNMIAVASSNEKGTKGNAGMGILKKMKRAGAALLGVAVLAASADETYQFIISGYPAENASSSFATTAVALETGTYRYCLDETDLEARYRSRFATAGVALNTREFKALTITIR